MEDAGRQHVSLVREAASQRHCVRALMMHRTSFPHHLGQSLIYSNTQTHSSHTISRSIRPAFGFNVGTISCPFPPIGQHTTFKMQKLNSWTQGLAQGSATTISKAPLLRGKLKFPLPLPDARCETTFGTSENHRLELKKVM